MKMCLRYTPGTTLVCPEFSFCLRLDQLWARYKWELILQTLRVPILGGSRWGDSRNFSL